MSFLKIENTEEIQPTQNLNEKKLRVIEKILYNSTIHVEQVIQE
jgi:hypothetical protein